ncbi:SDR family NAD(P)-dependent oxidoreductase [Mycobacterium sp. NAZ190054]|uniref:SDR family NAD(P)-dependent oxidoreductase n=1 Tax=Mycobacterium sp. NAZ190054 TaxID=1747766 RepID=UPI000796C603|nr:SDR family NAD(P)-dependent oxidoreductase [Mycobacterium sp. NAZ190054]KWX67610.1 short-chain dehydrogenase [Mycobacterium sp. NAZ190054]
MTHTIVMTGATRGIGRAAVDEILAADPRAHLVLLGRGEAVAALATELAGNGRTVSSVDTDLSSLGSVRAAVEEIRARLDSGELPVLRALVANAGVQYTDDTTQTRDGFEATYAVNVLANHALIRGLEDCFGTPSRIVITVSDTHFGDFKHNLGMVPAPVWQDPGSLARVRSFPAPETVRAGRTAYSTSKLAAIYLVHEYARRLPRGVDVVAFNPGFVPGTGLARDAGPLARLAMRYLLPVLTVTPMATSPQVAGRNLADVVLGRTVAPSGSYVDRTAVGDSSPESYSADRERETWSAAEHLVRPWRTRD